MSPVTWLHFWEWLSVLYQSDPTEAKKYMLAFTAGSFLYIGLAILLPELKRVHALNGDESEINKKTGHVWTTELGHLLGLVDHVVDCPLRRVADKYWIQCWNTNSSDKCWISKDRIDAQSQEYVFIQPNAILYLANWKQDTNWTPIGYKYVDFHIWAW